MKIENGAYYSMTNDEYHSDKESISRSGIMDYLKSPRVYWGNHVNPERPSREQTRPMILGSAFHTMILEPNLFNEQFAPTPPRVLLKDVGREKYDEYKAHCAELESSNKLVLTDTEYLTLKGMEKAVREHETASRLLFDDRRIVESSYFWTDKESGMTVKSRPDCLLDSVIVDLKTIADASPRGFQNAMIGGGYHIQGAMVQDALSACNYHVREAVINVCVEKTYPFLIGVYIIDPAAIEAGREKYKRTLFDIKHALAYNDFPDYALETIGLPNWAM